MNTKSWIMWSLPLLFFALQFVARLFPGLVMPEMMAQYNVDATAFGFFASLYYLGYSGMQIPCAWLLDRYGIRSIISVFTIICGLSCWISIISNQWIIVLISRFLIGASSAAGFLGVSKTISLWFAKKYYAKMVGVTFTFGLMGALYGGYPVSILIQQIGWLQVSTLLGSILVILGTLIYIFVRAPKQMTFEIQTPIKKTLKEILCNKLLVSIAIANLLMVGSLEGFADVWGVTYLMQTRDILKTQATTITSFIFFGMLFGGPILAWIAGYFKNYYIVTAASGIIMALIFTLVLIYNNLLSHQMMCSLMFITGILCCYQVLVFAIGSEIVSKEKMGITIAFLNSINMLGGTFFHATIGLLMDIAWDGHMLNSTKIYSDFAYSIALSIIPIAAIVGSSIFLLANKSTKQTR